MEISMRQVKSGGQVLPMFALSLTALLVFVGLAVDAGYAFSMNRQSQNGADFAAMAGTRIIGEYNVGNTANGTALNVYRAISAELGAHNAALVRATYVTAEGAAIPGGDVATLGTSPNAGNYGSIPIESTGVVVEARISWNPFVLGVVGMKDWAASTTGTAVTAGQSLGGGVLTVGVSTTAYGGLTSCPVTNLSTCTQQNLYAGSSQFPAGGFGWLKFGASGKCNGFGLGMDPGRGCQSNQPFLDTQIGPPSDSYGCCTAIDPANPGANRIGSLTGNEWANLSYYIDNHIAVWVPIFDPSQTSGSGANASYGIVGFAPVIFMAEGDGSPHAKTLVGAAVSGVGCPGTGNEPVSGFSYTMCKAPGGAITLGATGSVRLVH